MNSSHVDRNKLRRRLSILIPQLGGAQKSQQLPFAPFNNMDPLSRDNAGELREYQVVFTNPGTTRIFSQVHKSESYVMKISEDFITVMPLSSSGMSSASASGGSYFSEAKDEGGKSREKKMKKTGAKRKYGSYSKKRLTKAPIYMETVTETGVIPGKDNGFYIVVDTDQYYFESDSKDEILQQLDYIFSKRAEKDAASIPPVPPPPPPVPPPPPPSAPSQ